MKLISFLPAAAVCGTSLPNCNDTFNINGEPIIGCQESSVVPPPKIKNGNPKAGCEQNVMDADIEWCGALNYSMSSCVGWIREELEYYCDRPYYSCIISDASSWAAWRTWQAQGYGKTIICGVADTSDVNKSELQRACDTGNRYCDGSPSCIRDYIVESSPYKFCPKDFDLMVSKCCWAWNTYGGTNVSGATHDCLAYCTP